MKNLFIALTAVMLLSISVFAQPDTLWTRTYGGPNNDEGRCIQQTADGGFVIVGNYEWSGSNVDIYLIRTDPMGDTLWTNKYGGDYQEYAFDIKITSPDNGFIIAGTKSMSGTTNKDVYLLKLDSNGVYNWEANFGGSYDDWGKSVYQTTDGGYIIAGYYSFGYFNRDIYLIKTDSEGILSWERTYGGNFHDQGCCVQQTSDGGYIVAGEKGISSTDIQAYVLKTDTNGDIDWDYMYGNNYYDYAYFIQRILPDNGYIVVGKKGITNSNDDILLFKLTLDGNLVWDHIYGGPWNDAGKCVRQTNPDNNFVIVGETYITNTNQDLYFFKTDTSGNIIWSDTLGGNLNDAGRSVVQTTDGGYAIAGLYTIGALNFDFYIIRYGSESIPTISIELTPANPPIIIPETGGSFDFNIEAANNTPDPQIFDVWTEVLLPQVGSLEILNFTGLTLAGNSSINRDRTQNVPASAPAWTYTYFAYVGDYSGWIVDDYDSFTFEKEGTEGGGCLGTPADWLCTGEPFAGETIISNIPETYALYAPYPNPFNPTTALSYQLQAASYVELVVYDVQGREAAVLVDGFKTAGMYEAAFDASELASGVYFARLTAGSFQQTQKLLLIK